MQSEAINELAAALAKAQGKMKNALLNKINPHFKSAYADLSSVLDAIREPLSTNGLSVTQVTVMGDGCLFLRTVLMHASGQWIASDYPLPSAGRPQELGLALTYARRYTLAAIICNAAEEDDDANAAEAQKQTVSVPRRNQAGKAPQPERQHSPQPQPVAPPINPETGEVSPHTIVMEKADDWIRFGQSYAAAIRASKSVDEASQWMEANSGLLAAMQEQAPKLHKRLSDTVAEIVSKISDAEDVLTEGDMDRPVNILAGG